MKTMGDITREKLNEFRKDHRRGRRFTALFLATSLMVSAAVGYGLRQTGISATADYFCGQEEHAHSEACYTEKYICGLEAGETEPTEPLHTHTQDCYEKQQVQVCGLGEHAHGEDCYTAKRGDLVCQIQEHTHGEDCFDEEGNQVCELEEHTHCDDCYAPGEMVLTCQEQEHTHEESCFETQAVLVCALSTDPQEPVLHEHSEKCVEKILTCGQEEHSHTELCLSDETADVEGPEEWAANAGSPASGFWAQDLLAVARAQLGYRESERNFVQAEDGTRHGYTRYGAWYGDPYGSWNGMFLAYCLHYAGVPASVVPQRAGVSAMLAETDSKWLRDSSYTPQCGDIAVYDGSVGVVSGVDDGVRMIAGDMEGEVSAVQIGQAEKYISVTEAYAAFSPANIPENAEEKIDAFFSDVVTLADDGATSFPEGTFDLTAYIDAGSLQLKKESGSQWIPATDDNVKDGDNIQLSFSYTMSVDAMKENATFQLPPAFKISEIRNGPILNNNNKIVGSYTIDTDGTVRFTYTDPDILKQESFQGNFTCAGSADLSKTDENGNIVFPGNITLRVNPKSEDQTGLSVEKHSQSPVGGNKGEVLIKYDVKVKAGSQSAENTVSILDKLNTGSAPKVLGSYANDKEITLVKHNADGTETSIDLSQLGENYVVDNAGENPNISITGLTGLDTGEYYILSYWVRVPQSSFESIDNGEGKLENTATGSIGTETITKTDSKYFGKRIEKTGKYDETTGRIKWTIILNNVGNKLDGAVLRDLLPEGVSIVGNGKLYWNYYGSGGTLIADDISEDTLRNGYTFPESSNQNYYSFEFETTVPTGGSLTNKAELTPPGAKKPFTDEDTVTIPNDEWKFSKKLKLDDGSQLHWTLNAVNTTGSTEFSVLDTIFNAKNEDNVTISDTHYGIASELEVALRGMEITWVDANGNAVTPESTSIEIHYYGEICEDGTTVEINPTDSQTHVRSFRILVRSLSANCYVKSVYIADYTTHWDSEAVPDGKNWVYRNEAQIGEETKGDELPYRKAVDFEKLVSVNGTDYAKEAEKTLDNRQLSYQLILKVPADYENSTITVVDALPEGATYVEHSAKLALDNDCAGTLTVQKVDEGIQFTINQYSGNSLEHVIAIRYNLNISDDTYWKDLTTGHNKKTYVNTARWVENDKAGSASVVVTRKNVSDIYKDGVQQTIVSPDGQTIYSNKVSFTIVINPQRAKLGAYDDYLEITDQISPHGTTEVEGDLSSVKLYYYHVEDGEFVFDRPVPTGLYQILDPADRNWLRMRVPNEEAFVLCYDCIVDPGNDKYPSFNNWAGIISGNGAGGYYSVQQNSDSSTISYGQLVINKIDNFSGTALLGAKFQIESYDSQTKTWSSGTVIDCDEDNGARFTVTVGEENAPLRPEQLYRITEIQAPQNYRKDETSHYIIFYKEVYDETGNLTQGKSGAFQRVTGGVSVAYPSDGASEEVITADQVALCRSTGMYSLTVRNTMDKLMVHKNWMDQDNQSCQSPVSEIQVRLYRYTSADKTGQPVDDQLVTLSADKGWEYSWTIGTGEGELAEKDDDGNPYLYYVEEVTTSQIWTVTASNNRGITSGTITLTNKLTGSYTYELPKTGGAGTNNYVLLGLLAMVTAMGGLIVNRKKFTGVNEK